ncbi:hypothetical protein [Salinarimonas ramus]|uniref:Uncharacterized protein n=1 Tax=Salinarimonas ramus TaxID=690164 RepID=A0A917Q6C1_9HYPH|nr:hypothetical protein [Salinarimonas ramus]GGK22179.1 hypothetical protein GCM10011322_06060 [Salinarimonas ramus]
MPFGWNGKRSSGTAVPMAEPVDTRYKIKAQTLDDFVKVRDFVRSHARVYVTNERRLSLSVDHLSDDDKSTVERLGAEVLPELRYDLERLP